MAYDGSLDGPSFEDGADLALSVEEKAALFDAALHAAGERQANRRAAQRSAAVIAAFARAYVMIRDREDGLV
jgi:hypothetical protein